MKKRMQIKELARRTGITVRTLHHYDAIGLLSPRHRSQAGYRLYDDQDALRLQQILVARELGLALEDIRRLLDAPDVDQRDLLVRHRQALCERRGRLDTMLQSIDAAIRVLDGEMDMDFKALFDGFDPAAYEAEAKERWGHTEAYAEAKQRGRQYGKKEWEQIKADSEVINHGLAQCFFEGKAADSAETQDWLEKHRLHIDRWFYPCSTAMHGQLAEMYASDPRFTAYYDRYAKGLANYIREASAAAA